MLIHLETLKNLRKYNMTTLAGKVDKLNITNKHGKNLNCSQRIV